MHWPPVSSYWPQAPEDQGLLERRRNEPYWAREGVALNITKVVRIHALDLIKEPAGSGSEHRRRTAVFVIAAVLVVAGIAAVALEVYPGGGQTTISNHTTQRNDFTLEGPVPLLTITPQNNTFTLTYNATTLSSPATAISFSLNQSYAAIYTNGTEWATYSQACSSILESSSSEESVPSQASGYSVSFITVSGPCYNPPSPGWIPVNGTAVESYAHLNSSQVELSVAPTSTPANRTMTLQFTITLNLKPGVYAIRLAVGVQTTSSYGGFFEYADLYPFPVIVES